MGWEKTADSDRLYSPSTGIAISLHAPQPKLLRFFQISAGSRRCLPVPRSWLPPPRVRAKLNGKRRQEFRGQSMYEQSTPAVQRAYQSAEELGAATRP